MANLLDTFYTYKFLKLLSTKWENTDAYKLGIIDENGKPLKKSSELKTEEEKKAYTPYTRLVFKLKRMMEKIPGGKSAVARYGAALALIKEHSKEIEAMGLKYDIIKEKFSEYLNEEVTNSTEGIAGKDIPLGKKGKMQKRKQKRKQNKSYNKNKDTDTINVNNTVESKIHYQLIGNVLIRVDEKKHVIKRRIVNGKRVKRRETASGKGSRYTRTGNRKLKSGAKTRFKHAHKKAYRKAHTASANAKRRRSMRKRRHFK